MQAEGAILKNALSIWDGKITFYTDDHAFVDALCKSGYSVRNKPYRAEPSGTYRYEFAWHNAADADPGSGLPYGNHLQERGLRLRLQNKSLGLRSNGA
jgi:hypothetical protein